MGKWLDKARLILSESQEEAPFVSFGSAPASAYDNKIYLEILDKTEIGDDNQTLYHARDLIPELSLIPGVKNDEGFIDAILASKNSRERHYLLSGYREAWLIAVKTINPASHQADNIGRNHANRWLYTQSLE